MFIIYSLRNPSLRKVCHSHKKAVLLLPPHYLSETQDSKSFPHPDHLFVGELLFSGTITLKDLGLKEPVKVT